MVCKSSLYWMRWSQNRALQVGYDSSGFECKYWTEASGIQYFNQTNKNTLLHGPTPSSAPEYWSTVLCLYWAHFCMTPMISVIFISKICIFPLQLQSDMRQRWVEPHLWLNTSSRCFSTSPLSIEMVAYLTHMSDWWSMKWQRPDLRRDGSSAALVSTSEKWNPTSGQCLSWLWDSVVFLY